MTDYLHPGNAYVEFRLNKSKKFANLDFNQIEKRIRELNVRVEKFKTDFILYWHSVVQNNSFVYNPSNNLCYCRIRTKEFFTSSLDSPWIKNLKEVKNKEIVNRINDFFIFMGWLDKALNMYRAYFEWKLQPVLHTINRDLPHVQVERSRGKVHVNDTWYYVERMNSSQWEVIWDPVSWEITLI